MRKKILFLLIVLGFLLGLTACGVEQSKDDTIVYVPEFVIVEDNLDTNRCSCIMEDRVYFWREIGSNISLACVSEENSSAEPLLDYQQITPPDIPDISNTFLQWYIGSLQAASNGTIWESVPVQVTTQNEGIYSIKSFYVLRNLDQNGKELSRLDITCQDITGQNVSSLEDVVSEMGYFRGFSVDRDGTIYAMFDSSIAVLDKGGKLLFILPVPEDSSIGEINSIIVLSDGRIGVKVRRGHTIDETETCLRVLSKETRSWGETISLAPGSNISIYTGDDNALFYYRVASTLYAWREGATEGEYLLNLVDSGININALSNISTRPDGRLILAGKDFYSRDFQLAYLSPTPAYQLGKTVLTLATFGISSKLQQAVQEFNQTNGRYRISVMDYNQYGDGEAAITRMATEIGAGKMPDILDVSLIPDFRITLQKYLEDLWPYLDSDPELGRDKLMVRALEAEVVNGKLFSIGSAFRMYSYTGLTSVVGSRTSWTLEEMKATLETMTDGSVPFFGSRERMLRALMYLGGFRFVDTETGTCHFDSSEFKDVLAFCIEIPERTGVSGQAWIDAYRDGEVMLLPMGISDLYFLQYARYLFGGEVSCVGIPNDWGLTGSSIGLTECLAMSSTCEHKEGAWAFLRTRLLPQVPRDERVSSYYSDFPINKSDFNLMAQQAMSPEFELEHDGTYVLDSNGKKIEKEVSGGYQEAGPELAGLHYYAATQADYDQIMALYNAIENPSAVDSDILFIITEVSGAYFAGDMTLDKAVELIQNRANLYASEQLQ